ncbi:DNA-binding transcriptional regulator, LacI/PurR family [Allokutzneria albata]|uniref:DNA-binding transcriptional regulator, LacI/PurR family n=1 Tax=Allokutzneria albata TaxID=211114 RepID=A0A1H0DNZ2_ALLAB|nr:DNA-binding transcriptional regulator, LacI/PurR family [Allokutzneria albata]
MRNGSSVTIYQVARAAGVSPSTVSNLLNGRPGRMLPATRQRVEEAIERLGYRPNRTARQLRTGRTQAIGLVVPSVANPFWGTFARHLEGAALAEDYHVLLCNSEREPERERRYLEQLWDDGIRGVVLCSSLPSLDHVKPLLDAGLTVVAFDRTAQAGDPETLVNISVDNVVGAHLVTQHLLSLGHRRLAYVSGSLRAVNRQERYRGYLSAIAEAGLDMTAANVELSTSDDRYGDRDAAELGRARTVELLSSPNPPTALVAMNDMCALGVCAGVRDTGRRVGEDVSVVGFDDILLAELYAPALTTVRQPLERMAAEAFQHLRTGIEGGAPVAGRSLLIRPELVVRASTAPPR